MKDGFNFIDNIWIDADDNCIIVYEWDGKVDKKNCRIKLNTKFYGTLEQAVNGLTQRLARKAIYNASSYSEYLKLVNEIVPRRLMESLGEALAIWK